jgi:hypothetical protein
MRDMRGMKEMEEMTGTHLEEQGIGGIEHRDLEVDLIGVDLIRIGSVDVRDMMILICKGDSHQGQEGDSMISLAQKMSLILNKVEGILCLWSEEEGSHFHLDLEWIHIIEMTSLVLPTTIPTTSTKITTNQ